MKILICSVPDGPIANNTKRYYEDGLFLQPGGIFRLIDWIESKGYRSKIYDINNLRPDDEEVTETFKNIKPTIVGLSAPLSHCYPNVKRLSKILRKLFPDIWIVVGGHISSSSHVILNKTETDICVVGDGEIPFAKLIDYFKIHPSNKQFNYEKLSQIQGIAYLDKDKKFYLTGYGEQIPASELKHPNYDKIGELLQGKNDVVYNFFRPIKDNPIVKNTEYYEKNINKSIAYVETAKGCVARCTFCQRYTKGYRTWPTKSFEGHITHLKEKYNIAGLELADENFGSNKKHAYEVARIMKKHNMFWLCAGVRVTSVNYEDLKFYKEHGCIFIKFGIESGSQKILDVMEKKFLKEDVYNAISNCKKTGIMTEPDAMLAGMPGETRETILESAKFMASLLYVYERGWNGVGPSFWAMAIPGTPLYEYCQQVGLIGKTIDEEEEFLYSIATTKANLLNYINTTNSGPREVQSWHYLFMYETKAAFLEEIYKHNKSLKERISKIYKYVVKNEIWFLDNRLKELRNSRYKNTNKFKYYSWAFVWLSFNSLLSIFTLIFPRKVMYSLIRTYAGIRYHFLEKKYKEKTGKQKYNFFSEPDPNYKDNFKVSDERLNKINRRIERSLRDIVKINREKLSPAKTQEEKGLDLLVQGQ